MLAMVARDKGAPLVLEQRPTPAPRPDEVLIEVESCGVCRTDLHVIDGELADPRYPIVPGHEVVGRVVAQGEGVQRFALGQRIGAPWLAETCGHCFYCDSGRENLCDHSLFNGYDLNGGYATHMLVKADYALRLPEGADPVALAPLLCAGLIGWRSLKMTGEARNVGLYGFGAAAHIVAQLCTFRGQRVFAFTRPGDGDAQTFALRLGAVWAGGSDAAPP
jgi:propanol-preferring alcohol dehydrogenase